MRLGNLLVGLLACGLLTVGYAILPAHAGTLSQYKVRLRALDGIDGVGCGQSSWTGCSTTKFYKVKITPLFKSAIDMELSHDGWTRTTGGARSSFRKRLGGGFSPVDGYVDLYENAQYDTVVVTIVKHKWPC